MVKLLSPLRARRSTLAPRGERLIFWTLRYRRGAAGGSGLGFPVVERHKRRVSPASRADNSIVVCRIAAHCPAAWRGGAAERLREPSPCRTDRCSGWACRVLARCSLALAGRADRRQIRLMLHPQRCGARASCPAARAGRAAGARRGSARRCRAPTRTGALEFTLAQPLAADAAAMLRRLRRGTSSSPSGPNRRRPRF